jgi:hypothetical protein
MSEAKLSEGCTEILDLVKRSFAFLFEEYGFKVIHSSAATYGPRCLIVAESKDFRVRFISEFGSIGLDIGKLNAEPSWGDGPKGQRQWFPLRVVVYFLQGKGWPTREESQKLGEELAKLSKDQYAEYEAGLLRPLCREVSQLFSIDAPQDRWRAFEAYNSPARAS